MPACCFHSTLYIDLNLFDIMCILVTIVVTDNDGFHTLPFLCSKNKQYFVGDQELNVNFSQCCTFTCVNLSMCLKMKKEKKGNGECDCFSLMCNCYFMVLSFVRVLRPGLMKDEGWRGHFTAFRHSNNVYTLVNMCENTLDLNIQC